MKCKCIEDTTIYGINVGSEYKYNIIDETVYEIIYNETDKTFKKIYGTEKWFNRYFNKI